MNKYKITVGQIREALKDVPDDVVVLFNVEMPGGENWDTTDVSVSNWSFMCPGYEGCSHTEPEMDWEIVFFVRDPEIGENSITTRD
jgi:hypothetical protein